MAQFSGFLSNYATSSRSKNGDGLLPTDLMSTAIIVPSLNSGAPVNSSPTPLGHVQDGFIYLSNLLIQFSATQDASLNIYNTKHGPLYFPISSKPYVVYATSINQNAGDIVSVVNIQNNSICDASCNVTIGNNGGQFSWLSIGPAPTTPIYTNIINSGSILNVNSVAMDSTGQYQYICTGNGATSNVYKNSTYGYGAWTSVYGYSAPSSFFYSISSDISGTNVTVVDQNNRIYKSNNSGVTWYNPLSNTYFVGKSVTMNSTGQYQYALSSYYDISDFDGRIYKSSNYGTSWSEVYKTTLNFQSITCNSTGQYVYVVAINGGIYYSDNYGEGSSWTKTSATTLAWQSITCDSTGQYVYAVVSNGGIYKSSNYGSSWSPTSATTTNWYSISSNKTGQYLTAVVNGGGIYYSNNYGSTWSQTSTPSKNYRSVAMNYNGNISTATTYLTSAGNPIYVSLNASN